MRSKYFQRVILLFFLALSSVIPAIADPLDTAFPAPEWKRGRSPGGFGFDCVIGERCGMRSQVLLRLNPPSPAFEQNVKDGRLNREWATKVAQSEARGPNDSVRVIEFTSQKGSPFGFQIVYECKCKGQHSFVATRTFGTSGKQMMTIVSSARDQKSAVVNMNKMIAAMIRGGIQ